MAGGGGGSGDARFALEETSFGDDGRFDEECLITDPIHGPMKFHPIEKAIIDTPQFQRLRDIKQLGGSFYVYPAADHSRFVHSLGVAHLAKKMMDKLCAKLSIRQLIDEKDILCVSIAGLIHDLGHGPFSHLWENFMHKARPGDGWVHEGQSYRMFEALIEENGLWPMFQAHGFSQRDMIFIKELIHPPIPHSDDYPFKGRDPEKEFLYQIVSNPFSGIDVDKMDYIARDAKALGVDVNFDFRRYMELARILQVDDEFWTWQTSEGIKKIGRLFIGVRDKEAMNMFSMFRTRQDLHRKAYQHKTTKIIESLLMKIFAAVDDEEIFPVYSPTLDLNLRLSKAYKQTDSYVSLTNDVLGRIRSARPAASLSKEKVERLRSAQQMISDLDRRRLPKSVHVIHFNPALYKEWLKLDEVKWKNDLIRHHDSSCGVEIRHSDVEFIVLNFDYGQKGNDPIAKVPFYRKDGSVFRTSMKEISHTLPGHSNIAEQKIHVFATSEEMRDVVGQAARKWEATKKTEWSTPKRQRTSADFPLADFESTSTSTTNIQAMLSPASSMGGVEEGEEELQPLPERDTFDRPDTPPLSQRADESRRVMDEPQQQQIWNSGARRNLISAFQESPSP